MKIMTKRSSRWGLFLKNLRGQLVMETNFSLKRSWKQKMIIFTTRTMRHQRLTCFAHI